MKPYDGKVVHSTRDEDGVIDIVEEPTTLTMHFGTRARQTTMFLHDPRALALSYTHCMAMGLLFIEAPRRVLILGLGGGALPKFLLHHFPNCQVDVVEKRPKVVELARAYFHLPEEPRLKIFIDCAESFLRQRTGGDYDMVMVDIHDREGMAKAQGEKAFFTHCQQLMSKRGVLLTNLWSGERQDILERMKAHLKDCFSGQVMHLPVAGKHNTVALVFNFPIPRGGPKKVRRRANELRDRLGVDFPRLLWELARFNRQWR